VSSRSNLCAVSPVPARHLRNSDLIRIAVEHPPHIALHSDGVIASMRNIIQSVCGGNITPVAQLLSVSIGSKFVNNFKKKGKTSF
jgi:hypothetical protein